MKNLNICKKIDYLLLIIILYFQMPLDNTYKLREGIDIDKINWQMLSKNPNAIGLLESNTDKIDWSLLSLNPNAISLLKDNPDKIDWHWLSKNPNAIELLKANTDKIDWSWLSSNPCIFEINYIYFKSRMSIHFEEICIKVFHPKNEGKLWSIYGYF